MKNLTILAALGLAAVSSAQSNFLEEPTNIAFRLGYVYPIDSGMRDVASSYIGVGADFFTGIRLLKNAETTISIDWFGKSGSGAKGNAFPIMINQRIYNGDATVGGRSYFFFGAGVVFADITNADTVLGARVGYGRELGENLFAEGIFTYSEAAKGSRVTSLGFYLGYRF
jgi:hypothetical protein